MSWIPSNSSATSPSFSERTASLTTARRARSAPASGPLRGPARHSSAGRVFACIERPTWSRTNMVHRPSGPLRVPAPLPQRGQERDDPWWKIGRAEESVDGLPRCRSTCFPSLHPGQATSALVRPLERSGRQHKYGHGTPVGARWGEREIDGKRGPRSTVPVHGLGQRPRSTVPAPANGPGSGLGHRARVSGRATVLLDQPVADLDDAVGAFGDGRVVGDDHQRRTLLPQVDEQ